MGSKKTTFLVKLKEARKKAGYKTQEEFADAYHISLETVRNWEQGKTMPLMGDFIDLCDFLHCDGDYLLGKIDERTHTLQYIKDLTGLTEDSIHTLNFLHRRGFEGEKLAIDFLNLELSHLYQTGIKPCGDSLAPVETIFSMLYLYIMGTRPVSIMFKFQPSDGYQITERCEKYGVAPDTLYSEALMNTIRSHLEAMKIREKAAATHE